MNVVSPSNLSWESFIDLGLHGHACIDKVDRDVCRCNVARRKLSFERVVDHHPAGDLLSEELNVLHGIARLER